MFGNSKIKSITVAPNSTYAVWDEDITNVAVDCELQVREGCAALYIVNNHVRSTNVPGRWAINSKQDEKSNSDRRLVCVNTDKAYDIPYGIGGVPFHDDDINADTVVGAHGVCKLHVMDAWLLYTKLGKTKIAPEDIRAHIKDKLTETMTTMLARALGNTDYITITTHVSTISAKMKELLTESYKEIGLAIDEFTINSIYFQPDFVKQRNDYFKAAEERKIEKRLRNEEENGLLIIQEAARKAQAAQSPADDINVPVKYCMGCGMKVTQSAAFCPGCGKKFPN